MEVITRAVKVEALNECSAYRIIETLNASTTSGSGSSPNVIQRKFARVAEVVARFDDVLAAAAALVVGDDRRQRGEQVASALARFASRRGVLGQRVAGARSR